MAVEQKTISNSVQVLVEQMEDGVWAIHTTSVVIEREWTPYEPQISRLDQAIARAESPKFRTKASGS